MRRKNYELIIFDWDGTLMDSERKIINCFQSAASDLDIAPPEDADAIIDNTATGTTLARNGLRIIEVIGESAAVLIANKDSLKDREKREKIKDIYALLRGVVDAKNKLHIFLNVEEKNLGEVLKLLPALKGPTISRLSKDGWYAVNTVIEKNELFEIMPKLRKLAQGLVILDPRQVLLLEEVESLGEGA